MSENTECKKILEKKETKRGPEMSAKIAKVTRCMLVDLFKIRIDTIGH